MDVNLDRLLRERDLRALTRGAWYLLALGLAVLSVVARLPVALFAAIFALVIGLVPAIWHREALRHLVVEQQLGATRALFGETVTLDLRVENRKRLPLPWLEIEDEIPEQLPLLTGISSSSYKPRRKLLVNAYSLWAMQRVTRRYRLRCSARGMFTFGPVEAQSGDPFGWLVRQERLPASANATLLVFPLVVPIETLGFDARHPFGQQASEQRLLEDPLRVAGVRDYVAGDDPRRLHWKATARAGALVSKVYDPSSQLKLLVVLDVSTYQESWMGIDPDLAELAIAAAASIADWALGSGFAVGLLANALMGAMPGEALAEEQRIPDYARRARVPLESDQSQHERVLEALARVVPYFGSPVAPLLLAERRVLPLGTTVVFVGAARALRADTVGQLADLRRRGSPAHLALTGDPEDEIAVPTEGLPVHRLGGREVWHALVASAGKAPLHVE